MLGSAWIMAGARKVSEAPSCSMMISLAVLGASSLLLILHRSRPFTWPIIERASLVAQGASLMNREREALDGLQEGEDNEAMGEIVSRHFVMESSSCKEALITLRMTRRWGQ